VLARAAPARGMAGAQQVIELSNYLEARISGAAGESAAAYAEVGKVISVGDGIARVYGLANVQAGEMVVFDSGYVMSYSRSHHDSSFVLKSWDDNCPLASLIRFVNYLLSSCYMRFFLSFMCVLSSLMSSSKF
jgi:hypothetical protein